MTLKTSSAKSTRSIFLYSLQKNAGIGLINLLLDIFALPFLLLILTQGSTDPELNFLSNFRNLFRVLILGLMVVFSTVHCITLFQYLHNKRSIDLFHAFPVKRTSLFFGKYFAGLLLTVLPALLSVLLTVLIGALQGYSIPFLMLRYFLLFLLVTVMFFTFLTLLSVCSGTTMEMLVSGILLNYAYTLGVAGTVYYAQEVIPGGSFPLNANHISIFAPLVAIFVPYTGLSQGDMIFYLIWWILLTAFMLFLAVHFYNKRKSETAETLMALPALHIPLQILTIYTSAILFTVLLALLFGYRLSNFTFFIGALIVSVATFLILEALYKRTLKNIKKSLKWFASAVALFLVMVVTVAFGFFGYDVRIPDKEDIVSLNVELPYNQRIDDDISSYFYDSYSFQNEKGEVIFNPGTNYTQKEEDALNEAMTLHELIVNENKERYSPYLPQSASYYPDITFDYYLRDGSVFSRSIPLEDEVIKENPEILTLLQNIYKRDYFLRIQTVYYLEADYIKTVYLNTNEYERELKLTEEQIEAFLTAIAADAENLNRYSPGYCSFNITTKPSFTVEEGDRLYEACGYLGEANLGHHSPSVEFNPECTHVLAFLEDIGIDTENFFAE